MKKQFRIAVFAPPEFISPLVRTLSLAFERDNVVGSTNPSDLFPVLSQLQPTTLILDPQLFVDYEISVEDVLAAKTRFRCHILIAHFLTSSDEICNYIQTLSPQKEYTFPIDYLGLISDIPRLSKNKYIKVKEPLKQKTRERIDEIFESCGFHCKTKGAPYLKEALFLLYFQPELHRWGGATTIYKTLSEKYGESPRIIERSMLRTIEFSLSAEGEKLLRQTLNIPEEHDFYPISFQSFTQTFNKYYSKKYGSAEKLLRKR